MVMGGLRDFLFVKKIQKLSNEQSERTRMVWKEGPQREEWRRTTQCGNWWTRFKRERHNREQILLSPPKNRDMLRPFLLIFVQIFSHKMVTDSECHLFLHTGTKFSQICPAAVFGHWFALPLSGGKLPQINCWNGVFHTFVCWKWLRHQCLCLNERNVLNLICEWKFSMFNVPGWSPVVIF